MKPGLLILPFVALFLGAIGTLLGKANPNLPYLTWVGWGLALACVGAWVALDRENFKAMFKRKGAKYGASSSAVVLLGLLVIIGIAVLTSRPRFDKSFDVTKDKLNTLSDQSTKVIETLSKKNEDLKVTGFFIDQNEKQKFSDLLNMYQTKGAKLAVEYVDPQRDPTRAMSEKLTSGNTVILRLGTQENRVTTFTEEKFTNGIMKVLKDKSKKIYFTKGHGEGQIKGNEPTSFEAIVTELENNKYEVAEVSILEQAKVPEDADMLVIAGPKYDFKAEEIRFVEDYLTKGGAVFALVDAMTQADNLNALLQKFGLKLNDDLLILNPSDPRVSLLGQNNAIVTDFDAFSPVTKDFAKQSQVALLMPNSRSISEVTENANKMKVSLVAKTANIIIKVKNVRSKNDLGQIGKDRIEAGTPFAVIGVSTGKVANVGTPEVANADPNKPAGAGSGKETRIVLVGSSMLATNQGAQNPEHRDMVTNIANFLLQDEDFISIRPKDAAKSTINLATGGASTTLNFISFIYPFLFLVGGVLYWTKRRQA